MIELINPDEPSVRLANQDDLETLLGIMERANEYAAGKTGEPMWTNVPLARDNLSALILHGNCFVSTNEQGDILASISLGEEDTYMWSQEGLDGTALYFHKLMKDPEIIHSNSGLLFLSFVAREATRRHKIHVRCDTKLSMEPLINYYQRLGFKQKRIVPYPSTSLMGVLLEADPSKILKQIDNRQQN